MKLNFALNRLYSKLSNELKKTGLFIFENIIGFDASHQHSFEIAKSI